MSVPAGDVLVFVIVSFLVAGLVMTGAGAVDQIAPEHVVVDPGPVNEQVFGLDG
jgi:hypothetical protein